MGLLQKLKSALGLDGTGSSEPGRSGDVDVTVEREPSTEDEDAVKGTETASSGGSTDEPTVSESDDAENGGPSAEEFETLADETDADESATSETDADEAAADTGVDGIEEAELDADTDDTDTEGSTDPVTELTGIGPAYGDRLADAGIDTVGELAGADAADLADRIDLGESRVSGWIEQANEY
ncbi:helix-hairpin-helix domain-containing protein [Haloarcula sediminis]|uniref:helix-hairpin-helix domain-containing protein n=1 Tax=Haloarcula sediminis TaxID=3111777 RepID=UPI002D79D068|nr:helix-hairpin-helix domain-containing protein [Haloarcula sp. CK38]